MCRTTGTSWQQIGGALSQLTLFAGDSPANRSPSPGSAEAMRTIDTSGLRCYELSALSGRGGLWQKMFLASSPCLTPPNGYALIWKPLVTKSSRLWFRLRLLGPSTVDIESSLWPTPIRGDAHLSSTPEAAQRREAEGKTTLSRRVQLWPTATTRDYKDRTAGACANVPVNGLRGREIHRRKAAAMWPTAKAQPSGPDYARTNRPDSGGDDLATAVAREVGGSLNPPWVEWLMGFPPGWTALKPSETPSSRKSRSGSGKGS